MATSGQTKRHSDAAGTLSSASVNSAQDAKADIAFALNLANQLDLPFQITLARALAGIGIIRPAPAIVGRAAHRLRAGDEGQAGPLPRRGAAVEHPDRPYPSLPRLRARVGER